MRPGFFQSCRQHHGVKLRRQVEAVFLQSTHGIRFESTLEIVKIGPTANLFDNNFFGILSFAHNSRQRLATESKDGFQHGIACLEERNILTIQESGTCLLYTSPSPRDS